MSKCLERSISVVGLMLCYSIFRANGANWRRQLMGVSGLSSFTFGEPRREKEATGGIYISTCTV